MNKGMNGIFDGLDNRKDPTKRDYCSMCVFGDLGRGKSTFLRQLAKMYVDKNKDKKVTRRVLICDPSNAAGFDDFPKITLAELKYGLMNPSTGKVYTWDAKTSPIRVLRGVKWNDPTWFTVLNRYFKNGMVILDESRNYIPQNATMPEEQKEFFTVHRNACVDVVVVSHDFMNLNLWLRKAFRIFFVFRTGDKPTNEFWFEQRSLPTELYPIWQLLQRLRSPAAKMSPFVFFDKENFTKRLYADEEVLQIVVDLPNGDTRIVPYKNWKK
jgi:hypothetical protein